MRVQMQLQLRWAVWMRVRMQRAATQIDIDGAVRRVEA